jgi:hypothetical protein
MVYSLIVERYRSNARKMPSPKYLPILESLLFNYNVASRQILLGLISTFIKKWDGFWEYWSL